MTINIRSAKDRTFVRAGIALGEGIAAVKALAPGASLDCRSAVLESFRVAARHFDVALGRDAESVAHPVVPLIQAARSAMQISPLRRAVGVAEKLGAEVVTALETEWVAR